VPCVASKSTNPLPRIGRSRNDLVAPTEMVTIGVPSTSPLVLSRCGPM